METALTDSHAHLSYVLDRQGQGAMDTIIKAYSVQGSEAFILDIGVDYDDYPNRKALFGAFPFVKLSAGIWPDQDSLQSQKHIEERVSELENWARDASCHAIGECGLDYHWMNGPKKAQELLFRAQADLALKLGKALIVHSRDAHPETFAVVKSYAASIPVIIHCFSYNEEASLDYLSCGCYISFAGNLTYKNAAPLRAACSKVPLNRLLLETDSPYMNPEPLRGKPSSPLDIKRSYEIAAGLKACNSEKLVYIVKNNFKDILNL
ncbi:TatD family hydrolase [Spirochaetota bacterium]